MIGNFGWSWAIFVLLGNFGPFKLFWTILGHFGPFGPFFVPLGLFLSVWVFWSSLLWLFCASIGHFDEIGPFEPFWTFTAFSVILGLLSHYLPFWAIEWYRSPTVFIQFCLSIKTPKGNKHQKAEMVQKAPSGTKLVERPQWQKNSRLLKVPQNSPIFLPPIYPWTFC